MEKGKRQKAGINRMERRERIKAAALLFLHPVQPC
jgi:hypothetical protein